MDAVLAHEAALTARLLEGLRDVPGVRIHGPLAAEHRAGIVSFSLKKDDELVDAHLVAQLLDDDGIAVRAGGHCA